MVTVEQLTRFINWLINYVEKFYKADPAYKNVYQLKLEHSLRVCEEIEDIGQHCGLPQSKLRLAKLIALFHDLGRFEQYLQYRTFSDKNSENHAILAIAILEENNLLNEFDVGIQNLIFNSIENHNIRQIPHDVFGDELFFSKLLRDADKVDIFKVVTDHYAQDSGNAGAVELNLPNFPDILEKNFLDIESGRLISKDNLHTLNDFKLMQISWLFDVNFERTFEIIKERSYLEKIFDTLPKNDKVLKVKNNVLEYLEKAIVNRN